ncbi:OPT oligopeptide transporter protein-domain-containing protein [Lophiotrema nucula]|uniref:OPT oligopeptide transporter protein-domain-containing protein n=1 Tax=Lophiotrema nucula TaxID=690887 RepID=A0A6A5ZM39_9PLEO|nr:OPT oligopeptide transporter protein-domain-containing protein [Lophiotrema nucula]
MARNSSSSQTSSVAGDTHDAYPESDFSSYSSLAAAGQRIQNADNQGFSTRAVSSGLLIGVLVNVSNTYYGLRVGAGSQMSMVSALLGYIGFRVLPYVSSLSPAENVLLVSVATATGCMPLTAGLIQTIPALEYLIGPSEQGPLHESTGSLMVWSIGLSFFGIIFASLLRGYFVERERLPWPGASATAHLIGTLQHTTLNRSELAEPEQTHRTSTDVQWRTQLRSLLQGSLVSAIISILIQFFPNLHNVPIFGNRAKYWLWAMDLSPGFLGQGIIMGPFISMHMMSGAIVGWAILSPLAKMKNWAPGDIDDWTTGSRGWIIWVSLASLLADSSVKLGWVALRPLWNGLKGFIHAGPSSRAFWADRIRPRLPKFSQNEHLPLPPDPTLDDDPLLESPELRPTTSQRLPFPCQGRRRTFFPRLTSQQLLFWSFILSLIICVSTTAIVFGDLIRWHFTLLAIALSLPMAAVSIRSVAETDYNPDSAILSQLAFATLISHTNPNAIILNLISAALAVAGANQAGDLAYDLKVGQLVGASPQAQIFGQLIGSVFGALISCGVYRLYSSQYPIPGTIFRVPSAFLTLSTARLLLGQGLPTGVLPFVVAAAVLSTVSTVVRMRYESRWWQKFVPSGVAFAMGIYLLPSFSITRALGGLCFAIYKHRTHGGTGNITLLASGLVVGEAVISFLTVMLTAINTSTG